MDASHAQPSAHRRAPALLADFLTDFFAAFVEAVFLAGFRIDEFAGAAFLALDFLTIDFLPAAFLPADF